MLLEMFKLGAVNYTRKFGISLSGSNAVVITAAHTKQKFYTRIGSDGGNPSPEKKHNQGLDCPTLRARLVIGISDDRYTGRCMDRYDLLFHLEASQPERRVRLFKQGQRAIIQT